jgi:hypothetical protein
MDCSNCLQNAMVAQAGAGAASGQSPPPRISDDLPVSLESAEAAVESESTEG